MHTFKAISKGWNDVAWVNKTQFNLKVSWVTMNMCKLKRKKWKKDQQMINYYLFFFVGGDSLKFVK